MADLALHRTRDRARLNVPLRVERLEEDVDIIEHTQEGVVVRLDKLNARLFGVLIALVAALLALCANLIVLVVR